MSKGNESALWLLIYLVLFSLGVMFVLYTYPTIAGSINPPVIGINYIAQVEDSCYFHNLLIAKRKPVPFFNLWILDTPSGEHNPSFWWNLLTDECRYDGYADIGIHVSDNIKCNWRLQVPL